MFIIKDSEKLENIIKDLPIAIPTIAEIKELTRSYVTNATAYANLNGVAIAPFKKNSSYIVVDENGKACYVDPLGEFKVMDEERHKYCGVRPIIREDQLSKDVKRTFRHLRQDNDGLETIYLGTAPMKLAERYTEDLFMEAKANYDKGNSSSQFKQTSRVISENLGLGNLEITAPVYLFREQEFVLTPADYLPWNSKYAYVGRHNFKEEHQALLKVQPVTWIYDPRARVYICKQIIASARNMPFEDPQLPKDFAKQFVKR